MESVLHDTCIPCCEPQRCQTCSQQEIPSVGPERNSFQLQGAVATLTQPTGQLPPDHSLNLASTAPAHRKALADTSVGSLGSASHSVLKETQPVPLGPAVNRRGCRGCPHPAASYQSSGFANPPPPRLLSRVSTSYLPWRQKGLLPSTWKGQCQNWGSQDSGAGTTAHPQPQHPTILSVPGLLASWILHLQKNQRLPGSQAPCDNRLTS